VTGLIIFRRWREPSGATTDILGRTQPDLLDVLVEADLLIDGHRDTGGRVRTLERP
jgi:hypothetical protein